MSLVMSFAMKLGLYQIGVVNGSFAYSTAITPVAFALAGLWALYGRRAGILLLNAGVLQVFGINDSDSARLAFPCLFSWRQHGV